VIRVLVIDTVAGWLLEQRDFRTDDDAKAFAALARKTWPEHQVKIAKEEE
jgi:hypothetical protein